MDTSVESGDVGRFLHNGTSIGHEYTGYPIYFNNNCFAHSYLFYYPFCSIWAYSIAQEMPFCLKNRITNQLDFDEKTTLLQNHTKNDNFNEKHKSSNFNTCSFSFNNFEMAAVILNSPIDHLQRQTCKLLGDTRTQSGNVDKGSIRTNMSISVWFGQEVVLSSR